MFEITLVMKNEVTFGRLCSLLCALFSEHGNALPEKVFLKIQGKTVRLKDSDWLSDFGVGNGERIEIMVEECGESDEII